MRNHPLHRILVMAVTTVLGTVTALTLTAAPAHAAAEGKLLLKGSGTHYSDYYASAKGVVPGTAGTSWSIKVVNTSSSPTAFTVDVATPGAGVHATLLKGGAARPTPYTTPEIKAGGSLVLALKVKIDAGVTEDFATTAVILQDPSTAAEVDTTYAVASVTYETGTWRHDTFLKTGAQPWVGGEVGQGESSHALRPGQTATFTLRVKNDGGSAATGIQVWGYDAAGCPDDFRVKVTQAGRDVTAAVLAPSPTFTIDLAPGRYRDFKISIKVLRVPECETAVAIVGTFGPDGVVAQQAHVPIAV